MNDIVPELLNKMKADFKKLYSDSEKIRKAVERLKGGKATHKDSNMFAEEVGDLLAAVFKKHLSADALPDGKMHFNIADRILSDTLGQNYDLISSFSADVQTLLNEKAGLGLKGIKPKKDTDKIKGLIEKASDKDFEEVKWVFEESVVNFSQSIVDETIKSNVDFHEKLGLQIKVVRKAVSDCCDWCNALEGEYAFPDIPDDVWKRHRYCRCTVEYVTDKGRQNIHTKKWSK